MVRPLVKHVDIFTCLAYAAPSPRASLCSRRPESALAKYGSAWRDRILSSDSLVGLRRPCSEGCMLAQKRGCGSLKIVMISIAIQRVLFILLPSLPKSSPRANPDISAS